MTRSKPLSFEGAYLALSSFERHTLLAVALSFEELTQTDLLERLRHAHVPLDTERAVSSAGVKDALQRLLGDKLLRRTDFSCGSQETQR